MDDASSNTAAWLAVAAVSEVVTAASPRIQSALDLPRKGVSARKIVVSLPSDGVS